MKVVANRMKLTFLGTKGNIDSSTRRHRRHTSTIVSYHGRRVMIDCGEDWTDQVHDLDLHAIVITHAHPDHAFGLKNGAPAPVYATKWSWDDIGDYPIEEKHQLALRRERRIQGMVFEPFPVEHSTIAPAVGYRIKAGRVIVFYAPDLVYIHDRTEALQGARLYIGDGATLTRSMVRRSEESLIGHTPFRTQLTWCRKEGVPRAIVTHCGSAIVAKDERKVGARLRRLARERGVHVTIAHDGMEETLR